MPYLLRRRSLGSLMLLLIVFWQISVPEVQATTLYWDVNGTTAGFSTVVGTWGTSTWNDSATGGAGTTTTTTNNVDDLNIVAATTNTGTITVSGTQVAN